jgi:hypothetical protein
MFKKFVKMMWVIKRSAYVIYEWPPRFILKTTSDVFINVPKIIELIDQEMFASNRMYGELLRRMGPERQSDSKTHHHSVSIEEWPWR